MAAGLALQAGAADDGDRASHLSRPPATRAGGKCNARPPRLAFGCSSYAGGSADEQTSAERACGGKGAQGLEAFPPQQGAVEQLLGLAQASPLALQAGGWAPLGPWASWLSGLCPLHRLVYLVPAWALGALRSPLEPALPPAPPPALAPARPPARELLTQRQPFIVLSGHFQSIVRVKEIFGTTVRIL